MKLCVLLKNVNCRILGNAAVEIKGLYHRDTEVKEGGLFFCLRGTKIDGSEFVKSAVSNGAVAVVTEQEIQNLSKVTQVVVKDAREAMSLISCRFFGEPAKKLKLVGVTGTNGKTTTTNIISYALENCGVKSAVIGTNGVFVKGCKFDTGMTTPDPIELQRYLAFMVKNKIQVVCIEVSAHAGRLHKVDGVVFDVMVFTNLTEDHLDFFKNMEDYYLAKANLFTQKYAKFAVVNIDDIVFGKRLFESINLPKITYSIINESDYQAFNIKSERIGQSFEAHGKKFNILLSGKFNVLNMLASISVLEHLGISLEKSSTVLEKMEPVDGRFNIVDVCGVTVVVDYAHTPDGLKNILMACREMANGKRVISVFGCGGNRESQKRAIMGEISSKFADFTVITSDNPRYEKREDIVKDIEKGVVNEKYCVELDRGVAIKKAILMAKEGDVVVIAGKGSESYIDENGVKIPYSDFAEIEKIRRELNGWCLLDYWKFCVCIFGHIGDFSLCDFHDQTRKNQAGYFELCWSSFRKKWNSNNGWNYFFNFDFNCFNDLF